MRSWSEKVQYVCGISPARLQYIWWPQSATKLLRHRRTKESAPLPCPLHSKLRCLLFSIGSENKGPTLYGGDGGGKLYFLLLKFIKRKKAYFGQSVLTHFVADCRCSMITETQNPVNRHLNPRTASKKAVLNSTIYHSGFFFFSLVRCPFWSCYSLQFYFNFHFSKLFKKGNKFEKKSGR